MSTMERILRLMAERKASDIYLSAHSPALIRINGNCMPINAQVLPPEAPLSLLSEVVNEARVAELERTGELNMAIALEGAGNFRISAMRQRGSYAVVVRHIASTIPSFEDLNLPEILKTLVMEKRGLILMVGSTGAGKTTTLASMLDYRNENATGHILTVEDPIEYLFNHRKSLVNQREIGTDTHNYHMALQNALREAPDLIMIGEIRDKETMQAALLHTLTGHLCLSTIHANNSYHALSRIINLFPHDVRAAVLSDLSIGLRAIVSQRLVRSTDGTLRPAVEILLNTSLIAELIKNGEFTQIKEAMEQSLYPGSQTFEQALCRLYLDEQIGYDEAMVASDSATNLAWLINQNSSTARDGEESDQGSGNVRMTADFGNMTIDRGMLERS